MNAVVSVCKRGHRSYGHPNYCGTCGTKFFRCGICYAEVSFDANHACARRLSPLRVPEGALPDPVGSLSGMFLDERAEVAESEELA